MTLKRHIFILLSVLIIAQKAEGSSVDVRIFSQNIITSVIFSPIEGYYDVYGDDSLLIPCDASCIFQMNIENDSVHLVTFENDLGKYSALKFVSRSSRSAFKVKCVTPLSIVRTYDNDFEVKLIANNTQLRLINKVGMESYIAGVVQSESGKSNNMDYYKVQSIICRTYLLAHIHRHIEEGFAVCDDVHCQAYLSRSTESKVKEAVLATQGMVLVDNDLNLITAAFHSNCGGQTCNSEDVWTISTPYLKSIKDTFCLNKTHAKWERSIALEDWNDYLKAKGKKTNDSVKNQSKETKPFYQLNGREIYYVDGNFKLPLKMIRSDFKLKSTYFSIEPQNDVVIFKGKGYGHGVGLCQEGAMEMSKKKYNYSDILHYYFKNVHIVDLTSLSYFKQE